MPMIRHNSKINLNNFYCTAITLTGYANDDAALQLVGCAWQIVGRIRRYAPQSANVKNCELTILHFSFLNP